VLQSRPFDFKKVKVIVKKGDTVLEEILLDRLWTLKNIPHFAPVINGVVADEGIEITISANL